MEFWGIEVKPGETVKCEPGDDKCLHLSQASLGEVKKEKGNDSIPIYLKFDNQQLVIGTLSADKCPQITYDLVFEKEFELSHSWKNGSVFFVGYKVENPDEEPDDFMEDYSESEEDTPVEKEANGKLKSKGELVKAMVNALKSDSLAAKPSVKTEGKNAKKEKEDEDSDDDDDESDEDESDDEDMLDAEDGSGDEDEDESSEEEDDSPKKVETGKKRAGDSALKTPAPDKKVKLLGVRKTGGTDGKKGGHTATPHPAKRVGKTPATNDKSKPQTPKSGGSVSCKSCTKTFKDDNALQAHTKAKHAGK